MDPGLAILSNVAIILLIGLLVTILSKKLKLSNVLLLVLSGTALQFIPGPSGQQLFQFSPNFLLSVSTLAIVMIVFDSTSRFRWRDMDELSVTALKLTGWVVLANMLFFSAAAMFFIYERISLEAYLLGMIFSSVMLATDPTSLFAMMGDIKHKLINLLEIESIINTPLTVLLPFIVLDLINTVGEASILGSVVQQVVPLLQQVIVGVGAGIVIGIIIFRVMKQAYSDQLSPVGLITAALLAYIVAENMGGSGVLAVATLGLFFGSVYVKQKSTLKEFSSMLSNSLEILVFVLVGLRVTVPFEPLFYVKSLLLFVCLLICRAAAVFYALENDYLTFKEKLFATLNIPKGVAMAVVAFSFTVMVNSGEALYAGLAPMLDYMLAILVYTLVLSTIVTRMSKQLIHIDISEEANQSS